MKRLSFIYLSCKYAMVKVRYDVNSVVSMKGNKNIQQKIINYIN